MAKFTASSFWGITLASLTSGIAGFLIGGPSAAIILAASTFCLSVLTTLFAPEIKEPTPPKPFKIEDFQLPSVSHYQAIQRIYGEAICSGIYAHVWNFRHEDVKESVDTGKFGSHNKEEFTVGYDYYSDVYYIVAENGYLVEKPKYMNETPVKAKFCYFLGVCDKLNVYNKLPDKENKIFPWICLQNAYIQQLYLGRDVKTFPSVYFRIRDNIFENKEISKLSYIGIPTKKWGQIRGVNPFAVIISLLAEEFLGHFCAINSFLHSPYIEKEKFLSCLLLGLWSNLAICHSYEELTEIKEVISKICKLYGVKLTTVPKDKPFVLTLYSIAERSKLIEFVKVDNNANITASGNKQFLYDFVNQIEDCEDVEKTTIKNIIDCQIYKESKNIATDVLITLKHELNKQTMVHFNLFHNYSERLEVKRIDLSEFHYKPEAYSFLMLYATEITKSKNVATITTTIENIKYIDIGSPVRFFNHYINLPMTGRVTSIQIGNKPEYKVTLTIIID